MYRQLHGGKACAATLIRRGFGNAGGFGRSSQAADGWPPKIKRRAQGPPTLKIRSLQKSGPHPAGCPGGAEHSTRAGTSLLGLLGLLGLLRLFRLLRFLSHSILSGLMDGNATRGMLGGGPTSQHPQMQSQQIRRPLPRAVTPLSSRYPQLLCVFGATSRNFGSSMAGPPPAMSPNKTISATDGAWSGLTMRQQTVANCNGRETCS